MGSFSHRAKDDQPKESFANNENASHSGVEPTSTERKYLSADQASDIFGLSKSYLAKLRVYGGGPVFMKCGKRVLYDSEKFEAWLQSRQCNSTSEYRP